MMIISEVMIIICMIIWIELGICWWIIEMNRLEKLVIRVRVMVMMVVVFRFEVIVSVE